MVLKYFKTFNNSSVQFEVEIYNQITGDSPIANGFVPPEAFL